MRKLMLTFLIIGSLGAITGCTKDDGPNGNANLEHLTFTIQENQWYTYGTYGVQGFQYYRQIDVPDITQSIMEKGAVMVYIKQNDLFYPLPATTDYDGWVNTIQYNVYQGKVEIFVEDTDFRTENPGAMTLKIVIFDQLKSLPDSLNIKNYGQVLAYMNQQ
jgi:hypothetical protein